MTTNNDILARWRDAITDPPDNTWKGTLRRKDGIIHVVKWLAGGRQFWATLDGDHSFCPQPGDQWLDITTIPGVAREAVQAAVDEIHAKTHYWMAEGAREAPFHEVGDQYNHMASGLSQAMKIIEAETGVIRNTGVTPSEVTP